MFRHEPMVFTIPRAVLPTIACVLVLAAAAQGGGASARSSEPPTTDLEDAGATKISVPGDWLAAGAGAVWLSDPPARAIRRLDPETGEIVATVRVPQVPCESMDVGYRAVWTATCGFSGLARIDPTTNEVSGFARLSVPRFLHGEAAVGVGAGAVWVVVDGPGCRGCRVARVDPWTLRVVARIPVRPLSAAVRAGYGSVWVTNPTRSLVQKIDARRNRVVATTRVSAGARYLDVGEGGVWAVGERDGIVTRLSPATARVTARIDAGVVGQDGDLTVGGGWVWPRGAGVLLTRIDARTNEVVERYGPPSGRGSVIVGFGAVWVSADDVKTVWRLELPRPR